MSTTLHTYRARCQWSGSTQRGYRHYRREHTAAADPASDSLVLSADPAFLGRPGERGLTYSPTTTPLRA
ncbi:hypothetical protein ACOJVU_03450 [Mycobacterium sp. THU-M104]|uniref:hypothetical protein n=1 Tax=Mycobacterium sp. THU-M104 TaxID=3410515 RepID=UPI003B993E29